jgi:hypothetical protein
MTSMQGNPAAAATPRTRYYGLRSYRGSARKDFPHSRHDAFDRGVIKPQAGHILCAAYPAICGCNHRVR